MAKASMRVVYYLFLLTFCVDEGDGRWKKTDKEILQRDIKLFNKIAERVEHELKKYYDEYADEDLQRFYTEKSIVQPYKFVLHSRPTEDTTTERDIKTELPLLRDTYSNNEIHVNNKVIVNDSLTLDKTVSNNGIDKLKRPLGKWPKFEDMLLAMGKKYDWKNDRWIKVKEKFKNKENNIGKLDNSIIFHEKHRFSYRTIKLNRGKNKRNVVIAVTAIR